MTTAAELIAACYADLNRKPPLLYGQRAINGMPQRGPDYYDCIGWVRHILLNNAPELWPTAWGGEDSWTVPNFFGWWERGSKRFDGGAAQPGDIVIFSDADGPQHIGIAEDATWYFSSRNTVDNFGRSLIAADGRGVTVCRTRLAQAAVSTYTPREAVNFTAIEPVRALDTRYGTGLTGAFGAHAPRTFTVPVPDGAIAVTGNLTVTQQTSRGYLYVGPTPKADPTSSTLNFPVDDDRANGVTVGLGTGKTLSITFISPIANQTCHAIFDVTGYFLPATATVTGA